MAERIDHSSTSGDAMQPSILRTLVSAGLTVSALALAPVALAQTTSRPVVLVGPTFQDQASLDASAQWLRNPPYDYTVAAVALQGRPLNDSDTAMLIPGTASMAESASAVSYAVEDILYRTGAAQVDLIAYSQGAPVARYFLENYPAAREQVAGLISLGGVNYGIPINSGNYWFDYYARLECTATGEDGGPRFPVCDEIFYHQTPGDTEFLRALNEPDPTPWDDEIDYYHIYTKTSERLGSGETIELPGAINVCVQDACNRHRVTHVNLFTDQVVRDLVIAALQRNSVPGACPPR
jgi:triacylglycerol lipase